MSSSTTSECRTHLTREVRFSLARTELESDVSNSWGGWPSSQYLVPYLRLKCMVSGPISPRTGYVCNVKVIDGQVRKAFLSFLHQQHYERVPRDLRPETLLLALCHSLTQPDDETWQYEELELSSTPYLRYAIRADRASPEMITMTQQFEFSAAHRLHIDELSDKENVALFGKCNNPEGHGHNYRVDAQLEGEVNEGGQLFCIAEFEKIVKSHVIDRFDHKHLNRDTEEFKSLIPSVENIARVIFEKLDGRFGAAQLKSIRVYETPKTWADYTRY